jgi:uncharacterized protein
MEGLSTACAGVMLDSRPPTSETSPLAVGRGGETTYEWVISLPTRQRAPVPQRPAAGMPSGEITGHSRLLKAGSRSRCQPAHRAHTKGRAQARPPREPAPDRNAGMRAGRLPIDEQAACFRQAQCRNRTLTEVLTRAAAMGLPGWYLVAGCLYQTVWNVVTGQPPEAGILDYDLAYYDASDLSWDAEDAVIRAGNQVFAGLSAPVQIRNQARVHLWYEPKFGIACPPHASTEAAIDTYEATTACLGVRAEAGGRWRIYAPHGLSERVQPCGPAQPGPRAPPRVRGQDRPVAPAVAGADCFALARTIPAGAGQRLAVGLTCAESSLGTPARRANAHQDLPPQRGGRIALPRRR